MNQDKGPFTWLKKRLSKNEHNEKSKKNKYPYFLLLLLFGAAFMLISNLFGTDKQETTSIPTLANSSGDAAAEDVETFGTSKSKENTLIDKYEQAYESQLTEALDSIVGVEDVTVVVNVDATEKQVLEKNTNTQSQTTNETDREGGTRKVEDSSTEEQLVIVQNGESEVPIVVETKKPEIRGVLVVAKGADNITVKKWIIEAVTRVLDVPSHRVAVMPKKTKGDS